MVPKTRYIFSVLPKHSILQSSLKQPLTPIVLFTLFLLINLCSSSTCQLPIQIPNTITSNECSFTGFSNSYTYGVKQGPKTNSLYYMYSIQTPEKTVIRKVKSDNTPDWMYSYSSFQLIMKSLTIDSDEQFVYFGISNTPLIVCRLFAKNGVVDIAQSFFPLNGTSDAKIHLMSTGYGYYITGIDSPSDIFICMYQFSSSSKSYCQKITSFNSFAYGQLRLSDSSFFMLGSHFSSGKLLIYSLTFGIPSLNWALTMNCAGASCTTSNSESLMISSTIYSFFMYDQTGSQLNLYLAIISLAGVVDNSYKLNTNDVSSVGGSATIGDLIFVTANSPVSYPAFLIMFNIFSKSCSIRKFSGSEIYGMEIDMYGRLLIGGYKNSNGYSTSSSVQYLSMHPDFQTIASWTLDSLNPNAITKDTTITIENLETSPRTISTTSYTNQIITISIANTFGVNIKTNPQILSTVENNSYKITPDLTCPTSTSISSFPTYNLITTAFSWISINSLSGELSISAPEVNADTNYTIYINSTISAVVTIPVSKQVTITVINCVVSNCLKCSISSGSICSECNSGYALSSGTCKISSASETAQAVSSTTTSVAIATTSCVVFASFINASSIANLWLMVNQLQLFFLFLLTRAFIPIDIQAVITGTDFASNIYEYIPLEKLNIYPDFLSGFEFNLSNSMLDPFGINYESTIVNSYSIFASLVFMIILHLCIILLKWLFSKCKESRNCCYKFLNRAIERFLIIMTFGYYIRNALEISQFILISSVNEIHESNTSETLRLTSFIFAIIMVISYFAILGIINYLIFTNYKIDENAHNKLEEFFGCLQENKKSRFYVTMLLLRRLLFVTLLITLTSISSRLLIGILMFLQFVYGAYVVYIRPYKDTKSNIIEIINEVYFSLFLVTLMILNTEDVWTTLRTNIYVWILVSNSLIVFLIVFIYSIKTFISWLKTKCEKSSNDQESAPKVAPLTTIISATDLNSYQPTHNTRAQDVLEIMNENQLKEENKYSTQEDLSEIRIFPNIG